MDNARVFGRMPDKSFFFRFVFFPKECLCSSLGYCFDVTFALTEKKKDSRIL